MLCKTIIKCSMNWNIFIHFLLEHLFYWCLMLIHIHISNIYEYPVHEHCKIFKSSSHVFSWRTFKFIKCYTSTSTLLQKVQLVETVYNVQATHMEIDIIFARLKWNQKFHLSFTYKPHRIHTLSSEVLFK